MQIMPLAAQIEAPDPTTRTPFCRFIPGVAAYLNSGQQSFFDEFQSYFYMGGMVLSAVGSLVAVVIGRHGPPEIQGGASKIDRLIGIADQALRARDIVRDRDAGRGIKWIVAWLVKAGGGEGAAAFSVAISHARYAIEKQRAAILREGRRARRGNGRPRRGRRSAGAEIAGPEKG